MAAPRTPPAYLVLATRTVPPAVIAEAVIAELESHRGNYRRDRQVDHVAAQQEALELRQQGCHLRTRIRVTMRGPGHDPGYEEEEAV